MLKSSIALITLISASVMYVAALANCDNDVAQMHGQLGGNHSIQMSDGRHSFTDIYYAMSDGTGRCVANVYFGSAFICKMGWVNNDWGNTTECVGYTE